MIQSTRATATARRAALKVAVIYALFSSLWIVFSDQVLLALVSSADLLTRIQTMKGGLFIVVTAGIVYFLLYRELSEVKRAENELRESEEKYRLMAELTGLIVYDHEIASGKIAWSGSIGPLTGYSEEDFQQVDIGKWGEMVHADDRSYVLTQLENVRATGGGFHVEYRFRKKDGSYVHFHESGSTLCDGSGRVYRVLGSMSDISGQKKMEEQLRQAQKMEAVGTLAGGIAHDFNNILAVIIGYTEMAKSNERLDSKVVKDLDQVLQAGNRAKELVQQILSFSRKRKIETVVVDPAVLVRDTVKMLRSSLPTTIAINVDIQKGAGMICADPVQFNQVLMNLCTNAFHAMEKGGGQLDIILEDVRLQESDLRHEPGLKPGDYIMMTVRDSGTGIPAQIRERIFDPYFSTKDIGKGTGMGLAISHGIVKSCGGFMTLETEEGHGSAFQVYLPIAEHGHKGGEKTEDLREIPFGRERILYIDDEESLCRMAEEMFGRLGYAVTTATDGLAALELFRSSGDRFDLVITDQTMPNMAGVELAERMLELRHDIPIILCTGYSSVITEDLAKNIGIREFVMKPVSMNHLASLIRTVLGEGTGRAVLRGGDGVMPNDDGRQPGR